MSSTWILLLEVIKYKLGVFFHVNFIVKKNILAYKPAGVVSRSEATRNFGLQKEVVY